MSMNTRQFALKSMSNFGGEGHTLEDSMEERDFYIAWPESIDVFVEIEWTTPQMHDVLFSGFVEQDENAYFYAITGLKGSEWYSFYIGIIFDQSVSQRHKQLDHITRLSELKSSHPGMNFGISLGVPTFNSRRIRRQDIEEIEGLLIYANYHDDIANKKKISRFNSQRQIHIKNIGFISHLEEEIFYGVAYRSS